MTSRFRFFVLCCLAVFVLAGTAAAQETALSEEADEDVEKTYFDLRSSSDRTTRLIADRYLNLVRRQEWVDSTGKSTVLAKYLDHDPELTWVKLRAVKGSGADRVAKEITVPVDKLSKTCQSRVRQIDTLKKKLDELLVAGDDAETPNAEAGGVEFENPGSPMLDERGVEPATLREDRRLEPLRGEEQNRAPRPRAARPTATSAEADPDPLGFAEIDFSTTPPMADAGGDSVSTPGRLPAATDPESADEARR